MVECLLRNIYKKKETFDCADNEKDHLTFSKYENEKRATVTFSKFC